MKLIIIRDFILLICTNVKLRETATASRTSNEYPENLEPSDTMRLSQIVFIINLSIINIGIDRDGHDLDLEDQDLILTLEFTFIWVIYILIQGHLRL